MAASRAAASASGKQLYEYLGTSGDYSLPVPMMNILNGGAHADNHIDFQEFMIAPIGAESFSQALHMGVCVFHTLKKVLKSKNYTTNVGDEGGFAPEIKSNTEAIETVIEAIEKAGYRPGTDVFIALDSASTEFYRDQKYIFHKSDQSQHSSEAMAAFWSKWTSSYPIYSIEDGLAEDDWDGWQLLQLQIGKQVQLVGDDLFVTNTQTPSKRYRS